MHNITRDEYLANPCGTCSVAFWKNSYFKKPDGVQLIHEKALPPVNLDNFKIARYFRLSHNLQKINAPGLPKGYHFQSVDVAQQTATVADFINRCYENTKLTPDKVAAWTNYKVFDNDLWLFIYETASSTPAALGIADFDAAIGEGSLEWIQVLPEKRGKGLAKALVNELLSRLRHKAKFATVSGETDNPSNPEALYRKCGFKGGDVWCLLTPKYKINNLTGGIYLE